MVAALNKVHWNKTKKIIEIWNYEKRDNRRQLFRLSKEYFMPLSKAQIANSGHLFAGCSQKKAMAKVTVSSPYNATQEISGDSKR